MNGNMSMTDIMVALGLKHKPSFREAYIVPALTNGLIAMTQPDSPKSPTQEYYLTKKGRKLLE